MYFLGIGVSFYSVNFCILNPLNISYFLLFFLVMAKRVGIPTTDCNYFDYLRIEKSQRRCRALQKLQRKLDISLLDSTAYVEEIVDDDAATKESAKSELCEHLGLSNENVEVNAVVESLVLESNGVGHGGDTSKLFDLRDLRLAVLVATSTDGVNTLLDSAFRLFDRSLGDESIAKVTCSNILQKHLFLSSKVTRNLELELMLKMNINHISWL